MIDGDRLGVQFSGFGDQAHPFRHQGSADLNLYKLFLEKAYTLLRSGGRLGFVAPSGLYSDHGTSVTAGSLPLRRCRWEWLFGFENREGIFPIHRSYKFNPVVIEKGGATEAVRTVFMRRELEDWERAETLATSPTLSRRSNASAPSPAPFSKFSRRAISKSSKRSTRTAYCSATMAQMGGALVTPREFDMTNDSGLFPPRPQWEEKGYRPDEYSRWLLGDWRPIAELWETLGVDPSQPEPTEVELEAWLFDSPAAFRSKTSGSGRRGSYTATC